MGIHKTTLFKRYAKTHKQNLSAIHTDVKSAMDMIMIDMDDSTREIMVDNLDRCATRLQVTANWLRKINERHALQAGKAKLVEQKHNGKEISFDDDDDKESEYEDDINDVNDDSNNNNSQESHLIENNKKTNSTEQNGGNNHV